MLPESEYVADPAAWQGFGKSPAPVFGWDNSVTEGVLLCFMALLHGRDKARRSECDCWYWTTRVQRPEPSLTGSMNLDKPLDLSVKGAEDRPPSQDR